MAIQTLTVEGMKSGSTEGSRRSSALSIRVAGLTMKMVADVAGPALVADGAMRDFVLQPEDDSVDLLLSIHWADELAPPPGAPLFDSGGVWTLFRGAAGFTFCLHSPALGPQAYKLAVLDAGFTRGRVLLSRRIFEHQPAVYPLEYPLDELLMIHRLALGEGVELHACGLRDEHGRGLLFVGHSGAGKSTTARLWLREGRAGVLSDDRIILRREKGRLWMHGTPWHGDAGVAAPQAAPLDRIYFLEQGERNQILPLGRARAAAELLARSFVPFHSAPGLEFSLNFLAEVARDVPCRIFRFLPDATAVRAIEQDEADESKD
jgi:hypothetical protein